MIKLLCVTGNVFQPKSGGDQAVYNAIRLLSGHVEMHVFILGVPFIQFNFTIFQLKINMLKILTCKGKSFSR